jgi:hypothetical protein
VTRRSNYFPDYQHDFDPAVFARPLRSHFVAIPLYCRAMPGHPASAAVWTVQLPNTPVMVPSAIAMLSFAPQARTPAAIADPVSDQSGPALFSFNKSHPENRHELDGGWNECNAEAVSVVDRLRSI